jgi:hypothetical protein
MLFANYICYNARMVWGYISCEFCGAPVAVESDMAYRLKYHPKCKRESDRLAARARRVGGNKTHTHICAECSQPFQSKRNDARFCSPRCRVKAHREVIA